MAPAFLTLACPNCSGDLELTTRPDLFKCAHCSKLALLHWPATGAPQISRLEAKKTWKANLLRPGSTLNWQGGELCLTATELAFVPHDWNFGPLERAVLPLASIKDLKLTKAFAEIITDVLMLTDTNGEEWGLRVHGGDALRDELRRARDATA